MGNLEKKISTNFSKGLNEAASHTIQNEECQLADNFVFKDRSATVREGIKVHASLPYPVVALRKFYQKDGGNYFVAIAGGQVYNSVTSGEFTSVSIDAISGTVHNTVFDGAMYITDYVSPVKYFNGETTGVAGLSSPIFRKQITDMENVNEWTVNTYGAVAEDNSYLHRDLGDKAIRFSASSPSTAAVFEIGGGTELTSFVVDNSETSYVQEHQKYCRDLSGNICLVYATSNIRDIYLAKSLNEGSTWTETRLTSSPGYYLGPSIVVDGSNTLHVVFAGTPDPSGQYGIFYKNYNESNGWSADFVAASGAPLTRYYLPRPAVDSSNNLHIVCKTGDILTANTGAAYIARNFSGTWTSVSSVNTSGASDPECNPDIAIDSSNIRHIIWNAHASFAGSNITTIQYLNSLSSNTQEVTSGTPFNKQNACLAVDTSGNVHAFWEGKNSGLYSTDIEYKRKANNGAWGSTYTVTDKDGYYQFKPTISLQANNQIDLIWAGYSTQSPARAQIRYAKNLSGWSTTQNLTNVTRTQARPSLIYSYHPQGWGNSSGNRINRPNTGFAFGWYDGKALYYKASYDLRWDGDPAAPMAHDLNHFASDVSSDLQDIIQLFTVHNVKSSISSLVIQFIDASNLTASRELTNVSTWRSCSNDEWALHHSLPKSSFTIDAGFNWGSCNFRLQMTAVSSNPQQVAYCAIDNVRMIKTPPVITRSVSTTAKSDLLFFGSSAVVGLIPPMGFWEFVEYYNLRSLNDQDEVVRRWEAYLAQYPSESARSLQLEGLKQIADPIPSGIYYYKSTFLKESPSGFEIESNPTAQTSSVVVSNTTSSWTYIQLGNIPLAPPSAGVVGRRIYRRRSDEDVFRHVYTLHNNVVTTFFDNVPNTALGHVLEETHNPPPRAKYILRCSNQIVYYFNVSEEGNSYPSRARYSRAYEPYYCPLSNIIDISPDDGTEGTGMFEFMNQTHFLKERSTWTLDSVTNQPQQIHSSVGCVAPKSVSVGKNEVFWLAEEGIIKYNLYRWENVTHSKDDVSKYRIQAFINSMPKAYVGNSVGMYYNGYYLLAVTGEGSTVNDTVICYDVDNDVFSLFPNINVNCWEAWTGGKEGYRLFFGNNSGQICEFLTGDYDISTPIYSSIRTKDFGIPSPTEFFRKTYLFTENLDGQAKTLAIQPYYDFTATSSHSDNKIISGTYNLTKIDLPQTDDASFFSMKITTSGRYRINQADIYGRPEKLR